MKNLYFSLLAVLLYTGLGFAQGLSAKVIDQKTNEPISFATIQYARNRGVITNDEGFFTINRPASKLESISISSVGYAAKEIKVSDIKGEIIYLQAEVIQLEDVFISDKKLSGREILENVKERVDENYDIDLINKRFFFRESDLNTVKRFDLDIQESSIADIDQNLMDSISASVPKYSNSFKEVLGDLEGDYSSQEVAIIKGANLYNPPNTTSLENLADKLDRIFKENVKEDSYLKIKSGLLGVKVEVDEFNEEVEKDKEEEDDEDLAESEIKKKKSLVGAANSGIGKMFENTFWNEDGTFDLFDRLNRYEYAVKGFTYFGGDLVYVINFKPKGRADFKGSVYVDTEDFGVHRIDYYNIKPLKKLRLFGISKMDDVYRGKMIFSKDASGNYIPKYFENESGESVGVERPLKLIEKNKNVAGRRKQNELDMDILIKVNQVKKYQLIVFNDSENEENNEIKGESSEDFEYQTFKKYDPDFWKGYNIIEPNAAIKEFTSIQAK